MARFDTDDCRVPTNLFEAAAWRYAIVAVCRRCGAEAIFDAHGLWWRFEQRNWDQGLPNIGRRLRCRACGGRARVACVKGKAVTIRLAMPDEREWKRAVSRFRS